MVSLVDAGALVEGARGGEVGAEEMGVGDVVGMAAVGKADRSPPLVAARNYENGQEGPAAPSAHLTFLPDTVTACP